MKSNTEYTFTDFNDVNRTHHCHSAPCVHGDDAQENGKGRGASDPRQRHADVQRSMVVPNLQADGRDRPLAQQHHHIITLNAF